MKNDEQKLILVGDRYELKEQVGSSEVGDSFHAVDHVSKTDVLLTVSDPAAVMNWQSVCERVQSLCQVSCESVTRVLACHQTAVSWLVVTGWDTGKSLREESAERFRNEQRYSMDEIRQVVNELSATIESLHTTTYHGQISLDSIIRLPDGSLKLGAPAWHLPPRTDPRDLVAARRDDQRMLAAVIYELLTGRVPDKTAASAHTIRPGVPKPFSIAIHRALDSSTEKRFRSIAAFQKALVSPGSEIGGKERILTVALCVMAVVAVFGLGWKLWPQPTVATKADFARLLGKIEGERQLAERLDAEITSDAAAARDEIEKWQRELLSAKANDKPLQREYAEQRLAELQPKSEIRILLGDIWSQHRDKASWMTEAAGLLAAAKSHAEDGDLDRAMTELTDTEILWKRISIWRQNAQQAVEISRQTEGSLKQLQSSAAQSADWACAWPVSLLNGLNGRLMEGDGEQALSDARNAAASLPKIDTLLVLRSKVLTADSNVATLDQIQEARVERQKQRELLSEADTCLQSGKFSECDSLLRKIEDALQSVPLIALRSMYQSAQQSVFAHKTEGAMRMIEQLLQISSEREDAVRIKAESLVLRAELHLREGKFSSALDDCQASLAMRPGSSAYVVRASIMNVQREFDAAVAEADAALRIDSSSAEALNQRGFAYYQLRNFSEAMSDFNQALRANPRFADALTNRGLLYLDQAENINAMADFESALQQEPNDFRALAGRANLQRLNGNFAESIRDCDTAIAVQPDFGDALVCRGAARLGLRELDAGVADLKRAIELNASDIAAHVFLATAHNELKEFSQAVSESEAALALDEDCTEARLQRAFGLLGLQKPDAAEVDLDAVLDRSPQLVSALLARAHIRLRNQNPSKAILDFSTVISVDPTCVDAFAGRATANVLLGRFDSAIMDSTEAIKLDDQHIESYRTRAVAHAKLKNHDHVISDCSAAISLNGQFAECFTMRAAAYQEKAEYQKAIEDCTSALKLSPNLAEAFRIRAAARFKTGEKDEATADFNQALRLEEKK
jgi:tetratricopeptide (TPR) repeat protein